MKHLLVRFLFCAWLLERIEPFISCGQVVVGSVLVGVPCRAVTPPSATVPQTLHSWVSEELAGRSSAAASLPVEGNQEERCKQVEPPPTANHNSARSTPRPARRLTNASDSKGSGGASVTHASRLRCCCVGRSALHNDHSAPDKALYPRREMLVSLSKWHLNFIALCYHCVTNTSRSVKLCSNCMLLTFDSCR